MRVGNILIAVGALAPSVAGILSRVGLTEFLYLGELLGAIFMFIGFLQATVEATEPQRQASQVAQCP